MASSTFVNIRTTKLNEPNRFTLTYDHRTLFDFRLTEEEMAELDDMIMKFAGRIFEEKN